MRRIEKHEVICCLSVVNYVIQVQRLDIEHGIKHDESCTDLSYIFEGGTVWPLTWLNRNLEISELFGAEVSE